MAVNTGSRPRRLPRMEYGASDSSLWFVVLAAVVIWLLSPMWAGEPSTAGAIGHGPNGPSSKPNSTARAY